MSNGKQEEKQEALQRYETSRREQLGAAVNLTLGLASAAVGFCIIQVADEDYHFSAPGSYFFALAILVFILTVVLCILTTWTRLRDFRLTARKLRRELEGAEEAELKDLQKTTRSLGAWTWRLFYGSLVSLGIGFLAISVALWMLYHDRVFP